MANVSVFLISDAILHLGVGLLLTSVLGQMEGNNSILLKNATSTLSPGMISYLDGSRNLTERQKERRARQMNYCVNLLNYAGTYYPQSQIFPGPSPNYGPNYYPDQYQGYPYPQYGPPAEMKKCSDLATPPTAAFTQDECIRPEKHTGPYVCNLWKQGSTYTGINPDQKGYPRGFVGYCCCLRGPGVTCARAPLSG